MDKTSEASRKPIPKFASFRPKEHSPLRNEHDDVFKCDPTYDKSRARSKHRQGRQFKDEDRRQQESRHKNDWRESTLVDPSISSYVEAEPHSDTFIVDNVGDPKNLIFGTLDRYSTPNYSRVGAGNVIGSNLALKIDGAVSNEKGLVLAAQDSIRHHGKHTLRNIDRGDSREIRVKKETALGDAHVRAVDFIPLGSVPTTKRKRDDDDSRSLSSSSSSSSSLLEDKRTHFRSILGKAYPSKQWNDPDLEYISNADSIVRKEPAIFDDLIQKKRLELSRRIHSEPSNVEAWLQLILHQDESLGSRPTKAERRGTADVKMSMYEKALGAVKDVEGRQILLVEMMLEAPYIWDNQKLSAQWSQILKSDPVFPDLWTTYLDFMQTAFTSFRYEAVQNVFLDCIQVLRKPSMRRANNSLGYQKIYEIQIFVMLRMTLYMRESGFLEHAIAAWQALLEFEFFTPPAFSLRGDQAEESAKQSMVNEFERFWESEVPRIGEKGANGWASFSQSKGQPPEPGKTLDDHITAHGDDSFSTWIIMERIQALHSRQPSRTIDNITDNDPYRMILFSDIQPFLTTSPSTSGRYVLLDAFLIFCQLPIYGEGRIGSTWYKDGFLRSEALYFDLEGLLSNHVADWLNNQGKENVPLQPELLKQLPFDILRSDLQIDSVVLFAKPRSWFSAFDSWRDINNTSRSPVEPTWALSALKSLLMSEIADDQLAEYVLALELCLSPEKAKKTARNLLKKRTSSLRLYNAYALIEFRLGNSDKAENALAAAINMSKELDDVAGRDCILLWRTWIWELLSQGKSGEAFSRLRTYGDVIVESVPQRNTEKLPNPTKILRTENALRAFRENMMYLRCPEHAVLAMECLILFEYLKNISTLSTATAAFTENLHLLSINFTDTKSGEESFRQSFARLLYHHATHEHLFKPSEIRVLLAESVSRFPQNTVFLSLYAWNENRFRIDDRVRSIVQDVVLGISDTEKAGKDNVLSHFFAIQIEMNRGVGLGSNDNAIRATFERAIESRSGRHCAGIWKMYFLFEHSRRDLKKATVVFYRGIRACPWVKELYLLPFEYLRDGSGAMRDADLRGVYDLMVEKELRVHVDLEELIEQRTR